MSEESASTDVVTLTGHGGFFNGERYELPAGAARTAGRAETSSFPVTRTRNFRRLDPPRRPDALLALLAPEHVRLLYLGGGRLFVENVAGRAVWVDGREVTGPLEIDLSRAAAEIAFGPGEVLCAALPDSPPPPPVPGTPPAPDWFAAWVGGGPPARVRPDLELEPPPPPPGGPPPPPPALPAPAPAVRAPSPPRTGRLKSGFPWLLSALLHTVTVLALLVLALRPAGPPPPPHAEVRIAAPDRWLPLEPASPAPAPEEEEAPLEPREHASPPERPLPAAGGGEPPAAGPAGPGVGEGGDASGTALGGILPGPDAFGGPPGGPGRSSGGTARPGQGPVRRGLAWLARHQLDDGSFGGISSLRGCSCGDPGRRDFRVALTGLSALAFLGAGSTHRDGPYREELSRALRWLVAEQRDDGGFFPPRTPGDEREMYGNAIATLSIAEAGRLSPSALLRLPLARAVARFEETQIPYGGWRYRPGETTADTSVTGWVALALAAAERSGVRPQPFVRIGILSFLDAMTEPGTGWTGYRQRGRGSLAMVATGLAVRAFLGERRLTDAVRAGRALLAANRPAWPATPDADLPAMPDLYYFWFGTLASRAAGGEHQRQWNAALERALHPRQETKGEAAGSWPPAGRFEIPGGRLLSTTLAILCLEAAGPWPAAFR